MSNRNIWLDGIMGVVVGDALGLPVQFTSREDVEEEPVTEMIGYGAFNMPPGSWSDDSSLTLATLSSINELGEIDSEDIMKRFVRWYDNGEYTPFGYAYDIGYTCETAICNYKDTHDYKACGLSDVRSNGNGSLTKATKTYSTIEHIFLKTEGNGATFGKNGTLTKYCDCGYVETDILYGINEKVLSQTDFVYNGKQQNPNVIIKNLKGNTLTGVTVYEIPIVKDIGKYKITIKLREPYEGEKTVYFTIRPGTTEEVKATQTTTSVTLKWSKVPKATGYRVYQYNYSTGKWKAIKTTTERTYTVKNLKPGTKYKFSVKAYTKTADGTIWSNNTTHIETATKPATPTLKLSSSKKGTANISWSNVNGESGYQVYYSIKKNGDYKEVNTYKANVTTGSKTKLSSGKTYYFKVRAYKKTAAGTVYSSFSSVKSIKIK